MKENSFLKLGEEKSFFVLRSKCREKKAGGITAKKNSHRSGSIGVKPSARRPYCDKM